MINNNYRLENAKLIYFPFGRKKGIEASLLAKKNQFYGIIVYCIWAIAIIML